MEVKVNVQELIGELDGPEERCNDITNLITDGKLDDGTPYQVHATITINPSEFIVTCPDCGLTGAFLSYKRCPTCQTEIG